MYSKKYPINFFVMPHLNVLPRPPAIDDLFKGIKSLNSMYQQGFFISKSGYHFSIIDNPNALSYTPGSVLEIMVKPLFVPERPIENIMIPIKKQLEPLEIYMSDVTRFSPKVLDTILSYFDKMPPYKVFTQKEQQKINVYRAIFTNNEDLYNKNIAPKLFKREMLINWALNCNCTFTRLQPILKKIPIMQIAEHCIYYRNFTLLDTLFKNSENYLITQKIFNHKFQNNPELIAQYKMEKVQAMIEERVLSETNQNIIPSRKISL